MATLRKSTRSNTGSHRRSSSPTAARAQAMLPWLGAAFLLSVVNFAVVMREEDSLITQQSVLLIGLCGTIAAAGLAASRSHQEDQTTLREHRARPATDELAGHPMEVGSASYVLGMGQWTASMLELLEHAMSVTDPETPVHGELAVAAAETRDLCDLLAVESVDMLTINDKAKLHAVGTVWETGQARLERLAAEADAPWHRRWQARHVVERRLRHGRDLPRSLVLPYGD